MEFLSPLWFATLTAKLPVCLLKNNRQHSFFLCGDECLQNCHVPSSGCGGVWFFGLGCFSVAVGMGRVGFSLEVYVGMGGVGRVGNVEFPVRQCFMWENISFKVIYEGYLKKLPKRGLLETLQNKQHSV